MTIRTYLLLLIGLAGALGVSLSSIQRYTSQRQASSQRSLLAAEDGLGSADVVFYLLSEPLVVDFELPN